jgi:uncharacterized protein (DUF433 family)
MRIMEKVIHSDPEILGGTPVFCGTRVPVKNLFDYLETGENIDNFLQDFDTVHREQVVQVIIFLRKMIESPNSKLHESLT